MLCIILFRVGLQRGSPTCNLTQYSLSFIVAKMPWHFDTGSKGLPTAHHHGDVMPWTCGNCPPTSRTVHHGDFNFCLNFSLSLSLIYLQNHMPTESSYSIMVCASTRWPAATTESTSVRFLATTISEKSSWSWPFWVRLRSSDCWTSDLTHCMFPFRLVS